jgi:hypothetical protein
MTSVTQISTIADQVILNLARASSNGEFATIVTPILAYGHTFVPVKLSPNENGILVSDGGFARREVSMMGGDSYFSANANRIAYRYGIKCDGDLFFTIEGHDAIDAITAAVAAIANAAKETIETIAERLADKEIDGRRELLFTTLRKAFGKEKVTTGAKAQLRGALEEWEFDAVVRTPGSELAVIVVAPYANSVTTAFSKFSDLKSLNATTKKGFGVLTDSNNTPRLKLISNVATLIPFEKSTLETWHRYTEAA